MAQISLLGTRKERHGSHFGRCPIPLTRTERKTHRNDDSQITLGTDFCVQVVSDIHNTKKARELSCRKPLLQPSQALVTDTVVLGRALVFACAHGSDIRAASPSTLTRCSFGGAALQTQAQSTGQEVGVSFPVH